MKVLCYGSLNLDHIYNVLEFIHPGETLQALSVEQHCGGKGFNQAVAAAKAGLPVYLAGCIGPDGGIFRKICRAVGVDDAYLREESLPTGSAVIQVNQRGENCILLSGGANQAVTEEQIEQTLGNFQPGDVLIAQNEISQLPKLLSCAEKHGLLIAWNPSPMSEKITPDMLSSVNWLFVNEVEAEQLCGSNQPEICLDRLSALCPKGAVILTLGSAGSCYAGPEGHFFQPAFSVQAVDTTAAGDTFTGYFLASILKDGVPQSALELASKASALAVTRKGAYDSIPWKREVDRTALN